MMLLKQTTKDKIKRIEEIIGQDDGNRGMKSLIVPNDLEQAAVHIVTTLMYNNNSNNSNNSNNNDDATTKRNNADDTRIIRKQEAQIKSRKKQRKKNDNDSKGKDIHTVTKHVVILSGFPCCINESPPTETDGPPGTIAIAKCIIGLGGGGGGKGG